MKNALNNTENQLTAAGSGLMKGTAKTFKRRKEWRDKYISGETSLQFSQWMKKQRENVSNLPRGSY